MNFVSIILSLFFTAACLFRGHFGGHHAVYKAESDENFKLQLDTVDQTEQCNVLYFVDNTDEYDSIFDKLALLYDAILFYKVDTSKCKNTEPIFGVQTRPSVVFRKKGINEVTFISPKLEGKEFEKKLKECARYDKVVEEITDYEKFGFIIAKAERDYHLVITYIVNNDNFKDIEHDIETVAQMYQSTVKVFKINSATCPEAESQFSNYAQSQKDTHPKIVYRIFGNNRHTLVGYNWTVFYRLLLEDIEERDDSKAEETIINDQIANSSIDSVQYANDDGDFDSKLKAAETAKQLIILYIVENDNYKRVDKSVEFLARVFPTIQFIKVNTAVCKRVAKQFPDEGNTEIVSFPALIVRKFQKNRSRFVGLDVKKLFLQILLYKDTDEDSGEVNEKYVPTSLIGKQYYSLEYGQRADENEKHRNKEANPHFRSVILPIMENGATVKLTRSTSNPLKGIFTLNYTCAFDSFASIIMVAYKDSIKYKRKIDLINNDFFDFISELVKNGITPATYLKRTELIIHKTCPKISKILFFNIYFVQCDATVHNIVDSMLKDFPTKTDARFSHSDKDSKIYPQIKPSIYITYQTPNGRIDDLQGFLDGCFEQENLIDSYIVKTISDMHIFIDVLTWNEKIAVSGIQNSDVTEQITMRLSDIPKRLMHKSISYELRGVINYRLGGLTFMASLGHYYAYAFRLDKTWQLFDDTQTRRKLISVNDNTEVTIDLLVYTI